MGPKILAKQGDVCRTSKAHGLPNVLWQVDTIVPGLQVERRILWQWTETAVFTLFVFLIRRTFHRAALDYYFLLLHTAWTGLNMCCKTIAQSVTAGKLLWCSRCPTPRRGPVPQYNHSCDGQFQHMRSAGRRRAYRYHSYRTCGNVMATSNRISYLLYVNCC